MHSHWRCGPSLLAARGGLFGQMEQLWNSVGDGRGLPCALLDAACAEGEATDLGLRFMILPAFLDAARTGGEVTNLGLHLKVLFASAVAHFGEQVSMRTQPRSSCCALSI